MSASNQRVPLTRVQEISHHTASVAISIMGAIYLPVSIAFAVSAVCATFSWLSWKNNLPVLAVAR